MSDDEEDEANELAIDEDMSLVERVKAYCNSSISVQRLVHVRELSSCAQQIGAEETLVQLLPLLAIISSDVEKMFSEPITDDGAAPVPVDRVDLKRGFCDVSSGTCQVTTLAPCFSRSSLEGGWWVHALTHPLTHPRHGPGAGAACES